MKIRNITAIILVFIMMFSLSACTEKDEPQAVVREFFDCLEKANWNSADLLCDESIFSTTFFSNSRNISRILIDNNTLKPEIMKKTRLEAAGNSEINGDTATVRIRVSAYDLPTVLADYMIPATLSGGNQINIEEVIPAMLTSTETVESEITVTLNKQDDGSWLIHSTDDLADAITGGLATAAVSDAAEEETTIKESADDSEKTEASAG